MEYQHCACTMHTRKMLREGNVPGTHRHVACHIPRSCTLSAADDTLHGCMRSPTVRGPARLFTHASENEEKSSSHLPTVAVNTPSLCWLINFLSWPLFLTIGNDDSARLSQTRQRHESLAGGRTSLVPQTLSSQCTHHQQRAGLLTDHVTSLLACGTGCLRLQGRGGGRVGS